MLSRMVTHCLELLAADSNQNEILLNEERYNLGGISIVELHRLVYAQVLASHRLTSQVCEIMFTLFMLIGMCVKSANRKYRFFVIYLNSLLCCAGRHLQFMVTKLVVLLSFF